MSPNNNIIPTFEPCEPRLLMSTATVLASLQQNAEAFAMQPTESVVLTGNIDGEKDVYQFTATANGYVYLNLSGSEGLNTYLQVYNAYGKLCYRNDNANRTTTDSALKIYVRQGQTYYVVASGAKATTGDYTLQLTGKPVDDIGNVSDSARALTIRAGAAVTKGIINYTDDEDVFAIVADKSGTMTVNMVTSVLGAQLSAFDDSQTLSADGTGTMTFEVVKGQVYYIKAAGGQGAYRLNVSTQFTGETISAGSSGTTNISGTLASGECKVYKFTVAATGYIDLAMTGLSGSALDPALQVFTSAGRLKLSNDNASRTTTDSKLSFYARAGETYYVVASGSKSTAGGYQLTVTTRPVDDAGNTVSAAKSLALSSAGAASKTGTINYSDDVDVFSIVATKTGSLTVNLSAPWSFGMFDSKVTVVNAQGETIATATGNVSETVSTVTLDVVAGQTYYVCATTADSRTGYYKLTLSTADPVVTPEPAVVVAEPDTPTPGAAITTQIIQTDSGLQLLVIGTNNKDTITISQTTSAITITTAAGVTVIDGEFVSLYVYGFGGNDTLRLTNTVSAASVIYGGDGNDNIYDACTNASTMYGGNGTDTIVTLGGGAATVYGDDGLDSLWVDSTDRIMDGSTAEDDLGALHVISAFYQPYTTNASSSLYIPLTIAGQDIQDPSLTIYAGGYKDCSNYAVFSSTTEVSFDDITQIYLGDCYFLAALASLTQSDPGIIHQSVTDLGDGTYAVRFYRNGQSVYLRIDADLPTLKGTSYIAYAKLTNQAELWVPLLEKAYAYFRYGSNSYASIEGGWMDEVYLAMTGKYSTRVSVSGSSAASLYNTLANALNAGHAVSVGSGSSAPNPIVSSHAYMVKSVQVIDGVQTVTVYNPWNEDGKTWDDNYGDGLLTLTINQFKTCFLTCIVSAA